MIYYQFTDEGLEELRVALLTALEHARVVPAPPPLHVCAGSAIQRKLSSVVQQALKLIGNEVNFRAEVCRIIEEKK